MKKLLLAIALLLFLCPSAQAQIYRCVDRDGNEVYNSDGGPNCTLLYGDETTEETPVEEAANETAPAPAPQKAGTAKAEGGSLAFVESTADVVGDELVARGSVKNDGQHILRSVQVVVECYDRQNALVGTESAYTQPGEIPPGGTAEYEVRIAQNPRTENVKTVARWTEGKE